MESGSFTGGRKKSQILTANARLCSWVQPNREALYEIPFRPEAELAGVPAGSNDQARKFSDLTGLTFAPQPAQQTGQSR